MKTWHKIVLMVIVTLLFLALYYVIGLAISEQRCQEKYGEQWHSGTIDKVFICVDPDGKMRML